MGNVDSLVARANKTKDIPINLRGVRLQVAKDIVSMLRGFHETLAKQKLGRDPSPGEVIVHGLIKERALEKSFAEYLSQDPSTAALVGPCNVFLSHTWGSPFEKTVAAMEDFEKQRPPGSSHCFYFIDYFSINQLSPSKDLEELGELAKSCPTLVLFADPWNKPAVLGRA